MRDHVLRNHNGGRLQIGMAAGFASEYPAGLNRNAIQIGPADDQFEAGLNKDAWRGPRSLRVRVYRQLWAFERGTVPCRGRLAVRQAQGGWVRG
jgi:hypothetical protein